MIGMQSLTQLQRCVETVLAEEIPGDLIECGVWRGGACILMRAVLVAYGDKERCVWLADSFQGLPPPDPENYPAEDLTLNGAAVAVPRIHGQEQFQALRATRRSCPLSSRLVQEHASEWTD